MCYILGLICIFKWIIRKHNTVVEIYIKLEYNH
nr:MAG TPA: hypothetical protein [Caudoviricetes sp.]